MPTILSHAIVATAAGQWWRRRRLPAKFWAWTIGCAMLPDIDVISFAFGIRYEDMFGHRGLTHSLFFAAVAGLIAATAVSRNTSNAHSLAVGRPDLGIGNWELGVGTLWAWFAVVTASHGILDAMTNGGRGIAFFAPFSNERYFFPWRPIQVSPIGANFFSPRGLRVLVSESVSIWVPSAIMAASARMFQRRT